MTDSVGQKLYKLELELTLHEAVLFTLFANMGKRFVEDHPQLVPTDSHHRELMSIGMVHRAKDSLTEKIGRTIHAANACFDDECGYDKKQKKLNDLFQ